MEKTHPGGTLESPWALRGPGEALGPPRARAPMGWICLQALRGNCGVPRRGVFFPARKRLFFIFDPKSGQKKVEIEGVRPIWRDPQRNSASNPASDVQNGGMATHFKPNWCHFGSLGVPAPASTPLPGLARWGTTFVSLGCCPGGEVAGGRAAGGRRRGGGRFGAKV